ncbi:hypothetical protein DICPUDRAFT_47007 [Dictyostelium purpureum]|uniref:non-specific serine/threonine protein kinase n=1 Tax=Dictyostelium purpureum TaxID=5786 RepID=F0ZH84_DICPU|nr:uncharacterized protein DICPUDRAFT_47007 [Dictyostelium purpureum]EGC36695.1 hypothetical protein DICPUDRAFT_47007 [Dictyostelium purpureum]|eukprot:XP_003286794.1 hypothetical protein DICPUDRAFT_47007 [Dictyostelium purpureum]
MEVEQNYSSNFIIHLNENEDNGISYRSRKSQPKLVKHYILGEVLGEGAYGKVKDGMDSFTQKRVAVKILKRARLKKIPGGEASVLKEINITKKLHNKHVIKLIDHFIIEEKGKLYIVYEYVGGGTLQNLLENAPNGKLPQHQSQFIFKQLIEAIEYIHTQKILHRDIKPDNILFTHSNILKLSDFGVSEDSSQLEDFECLSRSYGSPAFQPPELTQFQTSFSPFKIDIWAMGVTLYLMTIGKFPFSGVNMYVLFENISKCKIEFPNDLDKDLVNLIKGILQVDHIQRFSLGQIKNHPWVLKYIPETEPSIQLLEETKFLPLEMAYGDESNDDELIFGYENDASTIDLQDPEFIPSSTSVNESSHHNHHYITTSTSIPSIPPTIQTGQTIYHHNFVGGVHPIEQDPVHIKRSSIGTNISDASIIRENYISSDNDDLNNIRGTCDLSDNDYISDDCDESYLHHHSQLAGEYPHQTTANGNDLNPNRSSPQPPLRNSSNRRPKITFESPYNKSKCIIN